MLSEGVQIEPDSPSEESRVLRNYSDFFSDLVDIHFRDIDTINLYSAATEFNNSSHGKRHSRLTSTRAANHSHFDTSLYLKAEVLEAQLSIGSISERCINKFDLTA